MKKYFLTFLVFLLLPIIVNAESITTGIIPATTSLGKTTEKVDLDDFIINKNLNGEFGINGKIINKIPLKTKYILKIKYYDINNNLIYTETKTEEIKPNETQEIKTSNNITAIGEGADINLISKYSLDITYKYEELDEQYYSINDYNIDIQVTNENVYKVIETITVDYKRNNKPFIKKIPINIKEDKYKKISITNLKIDSNYSYRKDKENYIIEIDGLSKKNEQKTYKITYEYKYGKDTNREYDELYYILNGVSDNTVISNLTFKIEMPYEFDKTYLEVALKNANLSTSNNIETIVTGNVITGKYKGNIYPTEKLHIQMQLKDNYFDKAKENKSNNIVLMIIIPLFSVFISFLIWFTYGKDTQYTKKKVSTIPDKLSSMEIGYLFKGKAKSSDISAIIIDFANKGYLTIEEDESDFALIKSFEFHKVKDYKGRNNKERIIFENLFKDKDIVTPQDLDMNFYNAVYEVLDDLNDTDNQGRIFENTTNQTLLLLLLTVLSMFVIMFIPSIEYGSVDDTVVSIFMISLYCLIYAAIYSLTKNKILKNIVVLLTALHAISYILTIPLSYALVNDFRYLFAFLFGFLCIVLLIIFIRLMPKRTAYGNKMLGRINGFKLYLETITPEEITKKMKDNPDFFYDMLPYAYVLGILKGWIKKFEKIDVKKPKWSSIKPFHFTAFNTFISHSLDTIETLIKNNI